MCCVLFLTVALESRIVFAEIFLMCEFKGFYLWPEADKLYQG